jgi:VIT1/CCC1 family predicted Fe2+/Mn2+ transporter
MPRTTRSGHGASHRAEPHVGPVAGRLGWLRAGVLGANDGIISTAGLVVGVAAGTSERSTIATAGVAGLVAGAVSMALGEYVSVSTQRDAERALVHKERRELAEMPEAELHELRTLLHRKGLSRETAAVAAEELTAHDALASHLDIELGIDAQELANPWSASLSSALAFVAGALLPLVAVLLPPEGWRIPVTAVAVLVALFLTGAVSARLGRAPVGQAVTRLLLGGALAMAVTYVVGEAVGSAV